MKIAYLTNCFGSQSHTFMRREIRALRARGQNLRLYGVRQDDESALAPDARDLVASTRYLYPLRHLRVARENLHYLLEDPIYYVRGATEAFLAPEFTLQRRAKMLFHYLVAPVFAREMQAESITHVHAHFLNVSASIAMYAAYHARLPFSLTVHSAGTLGTPHVLGVHQKLKRAALLLMISHYNIDYFEKVFPCRKKSRVVRCGMDLSEFPFAPRPAESRSAPYRILAVGRCVEKKGFSYLLDAAADLKKQGFPFELKVIGDGPLLEELQDKAKQLRLEDAAHFAGRQPSSEVQLAMKEADVVVVPSVTSKTGEKEGLPVVLMEAMASGVPVVATAHSGIVEIVRDAETGYLVPERDPMALSQALKKILTEDPAPLVAAARRLIEDEFDIASVAERREQVFCEAHASPLETEFSEVRVMQPEESA